MSGTNNGLNPGDIVSVGVSLTPTAAQGATQNIPIIIGSSDVIDVTERYRVYTGGSTALTTIAAQFGTTAPEYLEAVDFFAQTPTPQVLAIGRWADGPTSPWLHGGALTVGQQALSNFTSITNGSLALTYGTGSGTLHTVTGMNFTAATTLAQVAAIVQAAFVALPSAGFKFTWNPLYSRFDAEPNTSGATSIISFATPAGSGTDISTLMNLQSGEGGSLVGGTAGETPVAAVTLLRSLYKGWYFCHFAVQAGDTNLTAAAEVAVAAFIQSCSPPSTYGITTSDPNALLSSSTSDIAALIQAGNYSRTTVYYSSSNTGVALEMFSSFAVVNYTGRNTATIAMFKSLPGIVAETLTEAQAAALGAKNGNVFVNYSNGIAILQTGAMGSGNFFDEIHATDAFAATLQTTLINTLVTISGTYKVPQTDAGMNVLTNSAHTVGVQFVKNGVFGKGLPWQGAPIGAINTGDILPEGFYIYMNPLRTQSIGARQARQSPLMQIACNLSGAVQNVSVLVNVTR